VKAAVVTAVACHPVAVGIDERKVILVALAPEVGVIDAPPPSGTLPAGQVTLAATLVPFAGFAAVVVVACTTWRPETPGAPVGPCGPVAPWGPWGPVSP
jgi:hypothetical protein